MRQSVSWKKGLLAGLMSWLALAASAQNTSMSYADWATSKGLTGSNALPGSDPDNDNIPNALEYIFGTDPNTPDSAQVVGPFLQLNNAGAGNFSYRFSHVSEGVASAQVMQSTDNINWTPVPGNATTVIGTDFDWVYQPIQQGAQRKFFQLQATFAFTPNISVKIVVGTNVGSSWDQMPVVSQAVVLTQAPAVSGNVTTPNTTKYPQVVGTALNSFSPQMAADAASSGKRLRLRSWMGWFLTGNGTPPPGINPGYPITGSYNGGAWDYFSYQFPANTTASVTGAWKPIRMDQQPLYLNPFRINYAWPPGMFGYQTQPMLPFPNNVYYWAEKKIVRGPNLSFANPFFAQYANKVVGGDTPDVWRESWFYMRTRPLETLILVPSNLKPDALLANGTWNNNGVSGNVDYQPFPYPVWDTSLAPKDQTPFNIMVDRMGDWDADLIWEGTNNRAANYTVNHYQRSAFNQTGVGNYLKMTVAQGSPFIWCETNNNQYMLFYNLIRTNIKGEIDNNTGTGAKMVPGGPWKVSNVSNVSFVLFYGDHTNPNQWYEDSAPLYFDAPTQSPGGYNPPGKQHNFTYIAVYYKTDAVQPVTLGNTTSTNDGTDTQGNPYFYLQFVNPGKNWFVVGAVPVMHYYNTDVTVDEEGNRTAAALAWANEMGPYAFNFLTGTSIKYQATNMYKVTTTYSTTVQNPYVAAGAPNASNMTISANQTVMALMPHQYQPITLGPDLTQSGHPEITWNPLTQYDGDFTVPTQAPNANKSTSASPSYWGYWGPRGNMKSVITGSFTTEYPFQNLLPMMPPPNWSANYTQSGIQAVRITDVGKDNHVIANPIPNVTLNAVSGSGATFQVLLQPSTGKVQQINVVSGGSGYPDGNPPKDAMANLTIDKPTIGAGVQATARLQIGGGKILAVFMNNQGSGYDSSIQASQKDVNFDTPIIVPPFSNGNLTTGLATIITGGAGFNFSGGNTPTLKVFATGTGAKAEIVGPGQIVTIGAAIAGGFTSAGSYPSSGNDTADMAAIKVIVPPPANGQPAQTAMVSSISKITQNAIGGTLIVKPGSGYTGADVASFTDDNGTIVPCGVNIDGNGGVTNLFPSNSSVVFNITTPKPVKFAKGTAEATVYPGFSIGAVTLVAPFVSTYQNDVQVSFSGGGIIPPNVTLPQFTFKILGNGTIDPGNYAIVNAGKGLPPGATVTTNVNGGKGYDALLGAVLNSSAGISVVKVLRSGNNYPSTVFAQVDDAKHKGDDANFTVTVQNGTIAAITVNSPGSGYVAPVINLVSRLGGNPGQFPAKGQIGQILFLVAANGTVQSVFRNDGSPGTGYIPGTENGIDTVTSPAARIAFLQPLVGTVMPGAGASSFIATVIKPNINVEQVMYDNIIATYTSLASASLKPFGGGFGGASAPDGYGLGNQLSATAKFLDLIYQYQQHLASQGLDEPTLAPSNFAYSAGISPTSSYELPVYQDHNPIATMTGALQTSVQALQRTLTLLYSDPPYANNPTDPQTWQMQYFGFYDTNAGRFVLNPTATVPVQGVVSTSANPPAIPPDQNQGKTGLNQWQSGMLWSGFGVSDQWNDQHYFYGYYLSTAALAAILDGSWLGNITGKPSSLWSDAGQMGTAVDQWVMTLANDPDNAALQSTLYTNAEMTYQKFAFFDQWNGHSWATGMPPGRAGDVEDGSTKDTPNVPWSIWHSYGTGNDGYDDENENSIWEGLQPWASIVLWGGGTDRRAVVDLGMYLLATGQSAGDAYFHDKNYNLTNTANNKYTWVPVTTIASSRAINNGGNNNIPANTGYVETTPEAFYTAPQAFGGAGSAGNSILNKGSPSLNNFFYAFPTGSKFIESFPPTPWTLGISRNTDYMKRWAGSMMRTEWTDARNSSLYQPANWLSMALASALSGVPYNPGDTPYPMTGTTPNPNAVLPYVNRLWSSWVTLNAAAGAEAALQPTFKQIDVMDFLHVLDAYGTPDWTYVGQAVDSGGTETTDIVFTAVFTKQINPSTVQTTFVGFNPGWTTRYAAFSRIGANNSITSAPGVSVMPLPPKQLILQQVQFPVQ